MIKVLYAGDGAINYGYTVRSRVALPSLHSIVERKQLHQALITDPEISVTRLPPFVVSAKFPKPDELMKYNVLILSDIGYESVAKYPNNIRGPDRVKSIKKFVEEGGGFIHCGGSYGFHGVRGRAKWWGTTVADVLPTDLPIVPEGCMWGTEGGYRLNVIEPEHELMRGFPWDTCPTFGGYEIIGDPKEGATLLARIGYPGEEKDPGLAEWTYGKGRVIAFASDPVPGWGTSMCRWEHYTKFWIRVVRWLAKKPFS